MTEDSTTDDSRIERRQFVKAAGAGALGTTVLPNVQAAPGNRLGETAFAEVGMETEIDNLSIPDANPTVFHWDFPLPHVATDSTLFVRDAMSDEAREVVTTASEVVKGEKFQPASANLFGRPKTELTYEHGPHYRRNYVVELEEGYDLPQLNVSPRSNSVTIAGRGRERVPVGTERTFDFEPRELEAQLVRVTDEKVDNTDIPEHLRGLKKERWTEAVTVKPTLKVRNYGTLEVRNATDGITLRQ